MPESIVALEQLSSLDLRSNKLESLPASLVDLKSLKKLAVQKNQLQELPPHIEGMGLDAIGIQGNPGEAAMLERISSCKGIAVDSKGSGDAEGTNKLPKSWSSKIIKSRDFTPSRKTSKQKVSRSVKRKSQTHDDAVIGLYAQHKKAHKDKSGDRRDKHGDKKSAEEKEKKKKERSKKDKQVVHKQEVDLLPGKFQNGINFALTGSELRVRGASIDRLIALLTYDCGIGMAVFLLLILLSLFLSLRRVLPLALTYCRSWRVSAVLCDDVPRVFERLRTHGSTCEQVSERRCCCSGSVSAATEQRPRTWR